MASLEFSVSFMSGGQPLQVAVPPRATVAALKEEIHKLRPDLPCVQLFSAELGEDALKDADSVGSLGLASGAGLFAMEQEKRYTTIVLEKLRRWGSAFDDDESEWPYVVFIIPELLQHPLFRLVAAVFLASWISIASLAKKADLAAFIMLTIATMGCIIATMFKLVLQNCCILLGAAAEVLARSCQCLRAEACRGDSRHQRIRWSFGVGNILAWGTQTVLIILAALFLLDSMNTGRTITAQSPCVSWIWPACCETASNMESVPMAPPTAAPTAGGSGQGSNTNTTLSLSRNTNTTLALANEDLVPPPNAPPPPGAPPAGTYDAGAVEAVTRPYSYATYGCRRKLALSVALPSGIFGTLVALGLAHAVALACSKLSKIGGVGMQDGDLSQMARDRGGVPRVEVAQVAPEPQGGGV
jgi:hypothetical protein